MKVRGINVYFLQGFGKNITKVFGFTKKHFIMSNQILIQQLRTEKFFLRFYITFCLHRVFLIEFTGATFVHSRKARSIHAAHLQTLSAKVVCTAQYVKRLLAETIQASLKIKGWVIKVSENQVPKLSSFTSFIFLKLYIK